MGFTGNTTPVTCETIPVQTPYLWVQVITTGCIWCFKTTVALVVTWHNLWMAMTKMKGSYMYAVQSISHGSQLILADPANVCISLKLSNFLRIFKTAKIQKSDNTTGI